MTGYATNAQISVPLHLPGVRPDVDLGGVKFSYDYGFFYQVDNEVQPFVEPPFIPPPAGGRP